MQQPDFRKVRSERLDQVRAALEQTLARASWLPRQIPDQEWEEVVQHIKHRSLQPGAYLIESGQDQVIAGFVLRGIVRVFYSSGDGGEHDRYFAAQKNFFATLSAGLRNVPSNLNMVATCPTEVLTIDLKIILSMYDRSAAWDRIGRVLTERFYLLREQQVEQLMTLDSRARWDAFRKSQSHLLPLVNLKHIASYLGMRPETLARLRKEDQRKT